mgnify:CR=1 FL=1
MDVNILCDYCDGNGFLVSPDLITPGTSPCAWCKGTGIETKLRLSDGFYYSADIHDCIDFAEFQALNTNETQAVQLIIAASHINLNDGTAIRNKLRECFPVGITTNANLAKLICEPL